jgi:acyl-coenzyme A thioesterase PaaI-like protein
MRAPTPSFQPRDPDYAARVQASFARQKAMHTIGARLRAIGPGWTEVELPHRDDLTQQKGYLHGGIIGMIADNACGAAGTHPCHRPAGDR